MPLWLLLVWSVTDAADGVAWPGCCVGHIDTACHVHATCRVTPTFTSVGVWHGNSDWRGASTAGADARNCVTSTGQLGSGAGSNRADGRFESGRRQQQLRIGPRPCYVVMAGRDADSAIHGNSKSSFLGAELLCSAVATSGDVIAICRRWRQSHAALRARDDGVTVINGAIRCCDRRLRRTGGLWCSRQAVRGSRARLRSMDGHWSIRGSLQQGGPGVGWRTAGPALGCGLLSPEGFQLQRSERYKTESGRGASGWGHAVQGWGCR